MSELNSYEKAIIKNADWFIQNQSEEGKINLDGDEFYGIKGDATLIGHSVTVRMYAYLLTKDEKYKKTANQSLKWLQERQDVDGGWKKHSVYTLEAAQCVFEGYNTYMRIIPENDFLETMVKAADHMIAGTINDQGELILPNIIEIGEYAHFALLAWKITKNESYKKSADIILEHIFRNYDEDEGYWYPYDKDIGDLGIFGRMIRPILRFSALNFPIKGKIAVKITNRFMKYFVSKPILQYTMNLMDSEFLLDTFDASCEYPEYREKVERAVQWAITNCKGPFPGSLVESKPVKRKEYVYPIKIINNSTYAATWPTTCLLLAYCGLNEEKYFDDAKQVADYLISIQDSDGGFYNFKKPDGSYLKLQSGNVNFYVSMALWYFNEVYLKSENKLYTI